MFIKILDPGGSYYYLSVYQVAKIDQHDGKVLITRTTGETVETDNDFAEFEEILLTKKQVFNSEAEPAS